MVKWHSQVLDWGLFSFRVHSLDWHPMVLMWDIAQCWEPTRSLKKTNVSSSEAAGWKEWNWEKPVLAAHCSCSTSCVWLFATPRTAPRHLPQFVQTHLHWVCLWFTQSKAFQFQFQFSRSVVSDSLWPTNHSMPGLPVHHQLRSLPKPMSIESVMLSKYLILCHPLLLPSVFPSIWFFSSGSALHIRGPKDWSFNFSTKSCQWIFRVDFL